MLRDVFGDSFSGIAPGGNETAAVSSAGRGNLESFVNYTTGLFVACAHVRHHAALPSRTATLAIVKHIIKSASSQVRMNLTIRKHQFSHPCHPFPPLPLHPAYKHPTGKEKGPTANLKTARIPPRKAVERKEHLSIQFSHKEHAQTNPILLRPPSYHVSSRSNRINQIPRNFVKKKRERTTGKCHFVKNKKGVRRYLA